MTLALETGDFATWAGVAVAIIVAAMGYFATRRQIKISEEASQASHRQAEAAERRAIAVEDALTEALRSAGAANRAEPTTSDVIWELQRRGRHMYLLRNVGNATARGVRIDPDRLTTITRNLPQDASVRPQEALQFLMAPSFASPLPGEIWVTWEGQEEPVAVPIPS